MFEKDMHFGILLDFYGDILTARQREMLEYYYNDDMSLAEIADSIGISRQGVRSAIKKGTDILTEMENKLGLVSRFQKVQPLVALISRELITLSESIKTEAAREKINQILVQLNELNEI